MSNRTFYASTYVVADGVTRTWPFSFAGVNTGQESGTAPYLYPEDVKVQEIYTDADGNKHTVQRTGVLNSPNQITIDGPAILAGREIRIYRETELRFPLVDYRDLQSVSEHDLDLANRQAVFLAQETRDTASANLVYDAQGHFNAGDRRIVNMAPGVDDRDAVNMSQYKTTLRVADQYLAPLPDAIQRAGKLLGFDVHGLPQVLFAPTASALELEMALRDADADDKGATTVARSTVHIGHIEVLRRMPRRTDLAYIVDSYYLDGKRGGGRWIWLENHTGDDTYGGVLKVPGVDIGRFVRVREGRNISAYEYGVRKANTGVENRKRLTALYRDCVGTASIVHLMDEDINIDASAPVIVGADTTTIGGSGVLHPIMELLQPPQQAQNNPDGTRNAYGAIFSSGDPVTGLIWMGSKNNIYMGRIQFVGVKIRNKYSLTTAAGYALHGFFCNGGVVVYEDCIVDDMPNNGYVTSFYREAHYLRCKGRGNGWLAAGGAAGGAKNGISNTSTYTVPSFEYPLEDRSRIVTVQHCEFTRNKDEGVQYSSCPLVIIQFNDLSNNGDRAIEGDTAYVQTSKTRPNDVLHVIGNDCRGKSGSTRHSVTFNDGYNKDVYVGGNIFGRCTGLVLAASCTEHGSFTFTSPNVFELDDVNLTSGCHAMYVNAGMIDMRAGGRISGNHSRAALEAVMLYANNELATGGTLLISNFHSDVVFNRAITCRSKTEVRIKDVVCSTGRAFAQVRLLGAMATLEISDCDGVMNSRGYATDGIVDIGGLPDFVLDRLILRNNMHSVHATTRFPVGVVEPAPPAARINRLISSGNYWKDYSYGGGAARLTAVVGLAAKTSALDLPIVT